MSEHGLQMIELRIALEDAVEEKDRTKPEPRNARRCDGERRCGQGRILLKNFLTWFSSSEIR